jgi:hypothetical protein
VKLKPKAEKQRITEVRCKINQNYKTISTKIPNKKQ